MLDKVRDVAHDVNGLVVASRRDSEIAEVRHKCIGFPTEKKFDFHLTEALGVKSGAGTDSQRMV